MNAPVQQYLDMAGAELKRDLSQFFTPSDLAEELWRWSGLARRTQPLRILEPSCGRGALIEPLRRLGVPVASIVAYDADPENVRVTRELLDREGLGDRSTVILGDFTTADVGRFDAACINTPFENDQDIEFAAKVTKCCTWTFGIFPTRMQHSAGRREFWEWTDVIRERVLCERPRFGGTMQGMTDFVLWELRRRKAKRKPGEPSTVAKEWF